MYSFAWKVFNNADAEVTVTLGDKEVGKIKTRLLAPSTFTSLTHNYKDYILFVSDGKARVYSVSSMTEIGCDEIPDVKDSREFAQMLNLEKLQRGIVSFEKDNDSNIYAGSYLVNHVERLNEKHFAGRLTPEQKQAVADEMINCAMHALRSESTREELLKYEN